MARIVEVVAQEPFDEFVKQRIKGPLGMKATDYAKNLPPGVKIATLYTHDENGDIQRSTWNRNTNWTPGGSGLVSTAPDYMRFALMLWNRGSYDGVRILSPESIAEMTQLQVPSGVLEDFGIDGLGFGLGVSVVADEDVTLMTTRNGDFWWSGVFGTHFWVSPSTGVVLVVMLQNELGEQSGRPIAPYVVQGLALYE